jgi:2,4-dienoyl-CoA reductase-like NADH-dependent reductase (Old Yellow Enzyme family)/thioredoxin reductase
MPEIAASTANRGRLGTPLRLGAMTAKNRIGQAPMVTNFGDVLGQVTERTIAYYEVRAKGGAAVVIVEMTNVIDGTESRSYAGLLSAHCDDLLPGLNALAEAITRNDALAIIQLSHVGREASPALGRGVVLGPSAIPDPAGGIVPRVLTEEEIEAVELAFQMASSRAVRAGFDGVEVHAAHGYLLHQFLSPDSNVRSDGYGGDSSRRCRILREVLERVRSEIGSQKILGIRINGSDYLGSRGLNVDDAVAIAQMAEELGADYISVSAGVPESADFVIQPIYYPPATNAHLAKSVKESVSIPVLLAGSIVDRGNAEEVIGTGAADMVLLGRALLADPMVPQKWLTGDEGQVWPCIRCNDGCIERMFRHRRVSCAVNPIVGHEREWHVVPVHPGTEKRVLVAGGGPAGLEAARVAALRGHQVVLCEQESELGGQLRQAAMPDFKLDLRALVPRYLRALGALGVNVMINTAADLSLIESLRPDFMVVAVGAKEQVPDIAGINRAISANDAHRRPQALGKRVVIVGGGLVGCEVALEMARQGKNVTVIEVLPQALIKMSGNSRLGLLRELEKHGVALVTGTELWGVAEDGVFTRGNSAGQSFIECESVVLATGLRSRREVVDSLATSGIRHVAVGDCVEPRNIMAAIHEGFHAALSI